MPPKKKKSGKKKGKKSGKSSAPPTDLPATDEFSREFFFSQIRDLENRITRYQKKCDELELSSGKIQQEYAQITKDRDEMVEFLQKTLEQRSDELADLNDRYLGLQQAKEADREAHETELQKIKNENKEKISRFQSENTFLNARLSSLEEFKYKKDELEATLKQMEKELEEQKKNHEEKLYTLERKAVVDKDRLKKEMVMRVNQVAAEFRKVSNKQMAETTKRTIRENVSINAQLTKMSDKTMELIQENDDAKIKEKKQRMQIENLEHTEKEMAKKNHSNQKIIRMLTEKTKGQEALLAEYEMREEAIRDMESELLLLRQQTESQREELNQLSKTNEQLESDIQAAKADRDEQRRCRRRVEKVLSDAALSLKMLLTTQFAWEDDGQQQEMTDAEKRDNMLEHLLVVLNSAAAIGVGPAPADMGKQYELLRSKSALSEIPGSRRGLRKAIDSPGSAAPQKPTAHHYQLGDLGLVPRPLQNIPTSLDRTKGLSETTRLGNLRRVLTKSVGIQTVSAPKAMFFADQLLSQASVSQQHAIVKDFNSKDRMAKKFISKVF